MELEVNARGNLICPASKLMPMVQSFAITVSLMFGSILLNNDFDLFETLPFVILVAGFLALFAAVTHVLLLLQGDLEFNTSRQLVTKGNKVITTYKQIRQVEIRKGAGEEASYVIVLRLGVSRSFIVLQTQDETSASLDAAAIARVVEKSVVVV